MVALLATDLERQLGAMACLVAQWFCQCATDSLCGCQAIGHDTDNDIMMRICVATDNDRA
eukprot:138774-Amphidinium_carterae.1